MTPEEQIAWLREEVTLQTGASAEALDEAMRAPGHMPVVNLRMGAAHRVRFAAEHEERAAVVAWLRAEASKPGASPDERRFARHVADKIKASEHRKAT